jgi:glyoxylase-like metal-dependent hydrolase (beta-lactamase superfamily II)
MEHTLTNMSKESLTTCFNTTRLNSTTFVIREEDIYNDQPLIYVKIFSEPPLLLLSDTGSGGHGMPPSINVTSLRRYLETFPISSNSDKPLNPSGTLPYLIICTHCHSDHILGIPDFTTPTCDSTILASSYDRSFITDDLPTHSGCLDLGIPTPTYEVSYWAHHLEKITYNSLSLNIQILHTPGHTPDELAWYDCTERHLYVGDTFYELRSPFVSTPIMFPSEGNWVDYMLSLRVLYAFVEEQNKTNASSPKLKIGCAHITFSVDAAEIVAEVSALFVRIIQRKVPVVSSMDERGEPCDLWMESPEAKFSVQAPRRLAEVARTYFSKHPELLEI